MKAYFFIEIYSFIKSKKNQVIFILMFVLGIYFSLVSISSYDPIEQINRKEIQSRYDDRQEFLDNLKISEGTHFLIQYAAAVYPEWNKLDKERLKNLDNNQLKDFAKATSAWYSYSDEIIFQNVSDGLRYTSGYYTFGNYYAHYDGHFGFRREAIKYEQFSLANYPLTKNALEERTALQTFVRISQKMLPIILFFAFIFLIGDLLIKDSKNYSLVAGYPLTPFKRIIVKVMVSFSALILLIISLLPSFIILGCRFGFGNFNYPIPIYHSENGFNEYFTTISLGKYTLQFFGLLFIWALIFTLLVIFLSQLASQAFINLVVALSLLFGEFIYIARGFGSVFPVEWLPTSYISIGEIITGYHNFYYVTSALSVTNIFYLLTAITIILSGLCLLLARRKGRYI